MIAALNRLRLSIIAQLLFPGIEMLSFGIAGLIDTGDTLVYSWIKTSFGISSNLIGLYAIMMSVYYMIISFRHMRMATPTPLARGEQFFVLVLCLVPLLAYALVVIFILPVAYTTKTVWAAASLSNFLIVWGAYDRLVEGSYVDALRSRPD